MNMKNVSWLQREKKSLEVYSIALLALWQGRRDQADAAIQMSGLSDEQLLKGCLARLESAYSVFRGYGPSRKVSRKLVKMAYDVLSRAGVQNLHHWQR